jgi:hypothetical protein
MVHIKIQYDVEDRIFKLIDDDAKTLLEGDALCDLEVPLLFDELQAARC